MKTGIFVFPARWVRPRTLLVLILLALPFNLLLFPRRSATLVELSGIQKPIIDTWFAYTPEQVYQVLPALEEQGRQLYAISELSLDLVYPLVYNSFLWLAITLVLNKTFPRQSRIQKLALLPAAVLACDYAENILLAILLWSYPTRHITLAWAASFFTTTKWVLGALAILSIFLGLARYIWQRSFD